jgi:hypothetical protein
MTEGLKDSPVPWIRIRDLDLGSDPESRFAIRKNAGSRSVSGSALNQCESATLVGTSLKTYEVLHHMSFNFATLQDDVLLEKTSKILNFHFLIPNFSNYHMTKKKDN